MIANLPNFTLSNPGQITEKPSSSFHMGFGKTFHPSCFGSVCRRFLFGQSCIILFRFGVSGISFTYLPTQTDPPSPFSSPVFISKYSPPPLFLHFTHDSLFGNPPLFLAPPLPHPKIPSPHLQGPSRPFFSVGWRKREKGKEGKVGGGMG